MQSLSFVIALVGMSVSQTGNDDGEIEKACGVFPVQNISILWWHAKTQIAEGWVDSKVTQSLRREAKKHGLSGANVNACIRTVVSNEKRRQRSVPESEDPMLASIDKGTYPWNQVPESVQVYLLHSELTRRVELQKWKDRRNGQKRQLKSADGELKKVVRGRLRTMRKMVSIYESGVPIPAPYLSIGSEHLKVGKIVEDCHVAQVVDDLNAHVYVGEQRCLMKGVSTGSLYDGKKISLEGIWIFSGTSAYTTVMGSRDTIPVIEPYYMPPAWHDCLGITEDADID